MHAGNTDVKSNSTSKVMAQAVEHLLCNHEALSSNSSPIKNNLKKQKTKEGREKGRKNY
jgi:hypothetical protein